MSETTYSYEEIYAQARDAAQELLANLGMDVSAESVGFTRELKL